MKIQNPYWDIVKDIPGDKITQQFYGRWEPIGHPILALMDFPPEEVKAKKDHLDEMPSRDRLAVQYSWAIPHPKAIQWMVKQIADRCVVEIGAGTGYWAWLLSQCGVDVVAYDLNPPSKGGNKYHCPPADTGWTGHCEYHPIHQGDAMVSALHPDRALFLCWPPHSRDMAMVALAAYNGDTLFYCGEGLGGCNANDPFFAGLESDWELVADCEHHVSWSHIHDELSVYRRK